MYKTKRVMNVEVFVINTKKHIIFDLFGVYYITFQGPKKYIFCMKNKGNPFSEIYKNKELISEKIQNAKTHLS